MSTTSNRTKGRSLKPKSKQLVTLGQVKQIVKSSLGNVLEHKFFNTNLAMTAIAYTGGTYQLTAVPQGVTDYNRTGDVFVIRRCIVRLQGITGDATNMVRIMIFSWALNSNPAVTDILTTVSTAEAPLTQVIHDNSDKMKVYADVIMTLNTYTPNSVRVFDFKCNNKIQANTGSTTVGTRHIWLLVCSDSAAATHPQIGFGAQVFFEDG